MPSHLSSFMIVHLESFMSSVSAVEEKSGECNSFSGTYLFDILLCFLCSSGDCVSAAYKVLSRYRGYRIMRYCFCPQRSL